MTRWNAFLHICGRLRGYVDDSRAPLEAASWEAVTEVASQHLVTPALAFIGRDDNSLPTDLRIYLDALLQANRRRNEIIADCLALVVSTLNTIGIEPLVLKGCAALVDELYPDPAARFIGDIDLLVHASELNAASTVLADAGFDTISPKRWFRRADHRHLAPQVHPNFGIAVEIHKSVVETRFLHLLPPNRLREGALKTEFKGHLLSLPHPTDRVFHNMIHSHLHNGLLRPHVLDLRQLLELAILAKRLPDVDWDFIKRCFCDCGYGDVFRRQVFLCSRLLGGPNLPHAGGDDRDLEELKRRMELGPLQHLRDHLLRRSRQVHQEPRLAINLIDPAWWSDEIRGVAKLLKRKS